MKQKIRITGSLFIFLAGCLLALLSGNIESQRSYNVHSKFENLHKKSLTVERSNYKTDWIRVRYMGGECRYDAAEFPIRYIAVAFSAHLADVYSDAYVHSSPHFLFKLRGPPVHWV